MRHNRECGVVIEEPTQIDELAGMLSSGFHAPQPPEIWTLGELDSLRRPVEVLKKRLALDKHHLHVDDPSFIAIRLSQRGRRDLVRSFSGWLRLTLEAVLSQPEDIFSLNEVFAIAAPIIATRFPDNRHPRPKVRQQLQRLRDLGLVEFLGAAKYRRTLHAGRRAE